jgi:mycothiol synthase
MRHPAGELADEPVGEIYVLGVDPSAQGAGLGRALTSAGLDHLVGRGLGTAVLWVAGDNSAAIHTYRRAGFERTALDVRYARRAADVAAPPSGATMGA